MQKMSKEEVMKALGLMPFDAFREKVLDERKKYAFYASDPERQTGRTTERLVEAFRLLSNGKSVCFWSASSKLRSNAFALFYDMRMRLGWNAGSDTTFGVSMFPAPKHDDDCADDHVYDHTCLPTPKPKKVPKKTMPYSKEYVTKKEEDTMKTAPLPDYPYAVFRGGCWPTPIPTPEPVLIVEQKPVEALFRFCCDLNLQDHSVSEQREMERLLRELKPLLHHQAKGVIK